MSKLYDLLYTMIGKLNSSVKTTAQTLTDAEKTQARANIGAQPAGDYAKKTDIPSVPTKVSAFTNDVGYLTQHQDLSAYAKKTEIPSKLPNPHALTINGKTYDGASAVSIKVEGGSGGAQADWKAARGLPGHVLHRTHWVDESGTVLLDDDAVGFADGSALIDDVQLVAGASYIITYNGETEECVAVDDGLGSIMLRPNNLPVDFNYEAPNDEMGVSEAFRIYPHDFEESEAAIKIVLNSEIIHMMDKKFLPEDIGGGADWNASEGEPGHVLNRTHWVEGGRVEVPLDFTFDGDMTGKETLVVSGLPAIKMSNAVLTMNDLIGATATLQVEGEEMSVELTADNILDLNEDGSVLGSEVFFAVQHDCTLYDVAITTGLYFVNMGEAGYCKSLVKPGATVFEESEVVHKLDPKFLPDGVPICEKEVEILPETELVFTEQDGMMVAAAVANGLLEGGNTYTVVYNGTEYKCTAVELGTAYAVGNMSAYGGEDTGEPFLFITADAGDAIQAVILSLDGLTTAVVSCKGKVVVPIDSKYFPGLFNTGVIDFVEMGLPSITTTYQLHSHNNWETIKNALQRGQFLARLPIKGDVRFGHNPDNAQFVDIDMYVNMQVTYLDYIDNLDAGCQLCGFYENLMIRMSVTSEEIRTSLQAIKFE